MIHPKMSFHSRYGGPSGKWGSARFVEPKACVREAVEEVGLTFLPPLPRRAVLVPLDGSPFAEHALPLAVEMARRDAAKVLLVQVATLLPTLHALDVLLHSTQYAGFKQRQRDYLDEVVRRIAMSSDVPVTPILLEEEDIADSLCGMAESGADLVVMASQRRRAIARFGRASISDTLRRRLSVPLILARGGNEPPDLCVRPAVRQVLIALDGSASAERVLEPALDWGTLNEAVYTLVHVLPLGVMPPDQPAEGPEWIKHVRKNSRRADRVWRAAEMLKRRGYRAKAEFLSAADPARAILRHAQERGADFIALATRGRGGLSRLLRRSIADRLIRRASVPVLVFRPSDA